MTAPAVAAWSLGVLIILLLVPSLLLNSAARYAGQGFGLHFVTFIALAPMAPLEFVAAAAVFNPVRRRVRRRVDRRFHRARYDADEMVAAFAAQLKDTVDLDPVRDDLAAVVRQALEPDHVSVWISDRN